MLEKLKSYALLIFGAIVSILMVMLNRNKEQVRDLEEKVQTAKTEKEIANDLEKAANALDTYSLSKLKYDAWKNSRKRPPS